MPMPDAFLTAARAVNNWGRWGPDDEIGTLNLITDEVVLGAVRSVRTGRRFPLAIPLSKDGPQAGLVPGRDNPTHEVFSVNHPLTGDAAAFATSDDRIELALQAGTHWDGLAHVSWDGRVYNGFGAEVVRADGTSRLGVHHVTSLVSRGILLDIPRALGVEVLAPGHLITPADLEAAVQLTGEQVRPGDVVLVRTGQIRHFHAGDRITYAFPSPGPGIDAARWFHGHDVAAVATDTLAFEVFPCEQESLFLPVHLLHLVEMGMTQGQNFDLEALAADCATDGQYTFLLSATPEPVVGGVGSPVAPVAVK